MNQAELLRDLSRPIVRRNYPRWSVDVEFRRIAAADLIDLQAEFAGLHGSDVDTPEAVDFYCYLLERSCVCPACTREEWRANATLEAIVELGQMALEVNNLVAAEAKKN